MKYENLNELLQDKNENNTQDLIRSKVMASFSKDHTEYSITEIVHLMYLANSKAEGVSKIDELIEEYFLMRNSFVNPNQEKFLDIKPSKTKNDNLKEINIHINDTTYEHVYRKESPGCYSLLIKILLYRLYNRKVCESSIGGVLMVRNNIHKENAILNLQYKKFASEHDVYRTAFISGTEGPILKSRLDIVKTKFWKVVYDGEESNQHFIFILRPKQKRVVEFWHLEEQQILDLQICIDRISSKFKCFENGVWSINFGLNQAVYTIHIHFIAA